MILPESARDVKTDIDRIDGLPLSAGGDINPARFYEAIVHSTTYGISGDRDAFEMPALRTGIKRDLPALRICRMSRHPGNERHSGR